MKIYTPIALCFVLLGCSPHPSYVRVQNQMGFDLADATVITNSFGALKAGATSDYQMVPAVYQDSSVFTMEPNHYMRNYRHMGGSNPELASGRYTYILSVDTNKSLEISLKKEE